MMVTLMTAPQIPVEAPAGAGPAEKNGSTPTRPGESIQIVEFLLGIEHFAFDLFDVKEVVGYSTITKLPNVPPYVMGIIDLRGEILTIIDLRQYLHITEKSQSLPESSRIIILDEKIAGTKIGILVDDVTSVSRLESGDVNSSSLTASTKDSAIIGIIKRKMKVNGKETHELIIWLSLEKILEGIVAG
jgi:purine-binding chemotaxis protein CheW